MTDIPFDITAPPGMETVSQAFKDNFLEGGDLGAQFCVYKEGNLLLDFKGGWADRRQSRPVTDDTLFAIFSSGKAVAALVIAHLVEMDMIGYDQYVDTIWPEFGAHGKDKLTIAQILSHQAGLSGITSTDWTAQDWYDWDKTCQTLADQAPIFRPGSTSGYHPITYGFLSGEIARRADRYGRSLGQILRQDLCAPHDLDIWIGLPESEHNRCADMVKPKALAELGQINAATKAAFLTAWAAPTRSDLSAWRQAEFAGSNCHATANSLARIMQLPLTGTVDGTKFLSEDCINALRTPRISGPNLVLPYDLTFCAGMMQNAPHFFYGPHPDTLGHSGWGGSCVFADPETGISGAYVMSRQDNSLLGDKRPRRIIDALYAVL